MNGKGRFRFLSVCALVFLPLGSRAQWVQTTMPPLVQVFSIAVGGSNIFVGTDSAVYFSPDEGVTWAHPANNGMQIGEVVYAVAVHDTFLFAGTSSNGVFRSSDLGSSWQQVNIGLTTNQVFCMAAGDSGIFIGTDRGVFLSTNNGTNWQAVNSGIATSSVFALALLSSGTGGPNIFAGTVYSGVTAKGSIFLSTNNGSSWPRVNSGLVDSSVYCLAMGGGIEIFAGTFGYGVSLSTNYGTNWQAVNSGLANSQVISLTALPNGLGGSVVLAGTFGGGIYLSTNSGLRWSTFGLSGDAR